MFRRIKKLEADVARLAGAVAAWSSIQAQAQREAAGKPDRHPFLNRQEVERLTAKAFDHGMDHGRITDLTWLPGMGLDRLIELHPNAMTRRPEPPSTLRTDD